MFTKLARIVLIALAIVGCAPRRVLYSNVADSLLIQVHTREMHYLDSVGFRIPEQREARTIDSDSSFLQNSFAWSMAMWCNGQLYHALGTIPKTWYTPYWRRETRKDSVIYRNFYRDIVTEVPRELTRWQRCQIIGFWIMLLLIGLLIAYRKIIRRS